MYSSRVISAWILLVYGGVVSTPLIADDLQTDTPRKPPKAKKHVPTEPKTISELFEAFTRGLTPNRRDPEQVRLFEMYRRSRFGDGNTSLPNDHNESIADFEDKHPDIQKPVFREVVYKKQEYGYPTLSQLDHGSTVQSTWQAIQNARANLAPLLEVDRAKLLKKGLTKEDLTFLFDQENTPWKPARTDTKVEGMQKLFVSLVALRKERKEPSKFIDQTLVNIANVAGFDHGLNGEILESSEPNSHEKLEALRRGVYHREDFVGDMRNFAPKDLLIEGGYKGLLELTGIDKASKFPGDTNLAKGIEALSKELKEKAELVSSEPVRVRQMTPAEEALRSCVGGADCSSRTYLLTAKEADYIYFTETDTNHYSSGHVTVVLGEADGQKVAMVDKIQNVQNADIPYFIESVRRTLKKDGYALGIPEDLGDHNGLSNYEFTRLFVGNELESYTTSKKTVEGFQPHHGRLTHARYSRARGRLALRIVKPLEPEKRKHARIRTGAKYEPVPMGNSIMEHIRRQVTAHKNSRKSADRFEYVHSVMAFLQGGVVIDRKFYRTLARWVSDPETPPQLKNTILRQAATLSSEIVNNTALLNDLAEGLTDREKRNLVQNWLQTPGLRQYVLKLDEVGTLATTVAKYHPRDFIYAFSKLSHPQMTNIGKLLEGELDDISPFTRARAAAMLTKKAGLNVRFLNPWEYQEQQRLFGVSSEKIQAVAPIDDTGDRLEAKHYPSLQKHFGFGPTDFLKELGEYEGGQYLAEVARWARENKDADGSTGHASRDFLKRQPGQAARKIEKLLKREAYDSDEGMKRASPVLFELAKGGLIDFWKEIPKIYGDVPPRHRAALIYELTRHKWPEGREREQMRFLANFDANEAVLYLSANHNSRQLSPAEFNLFKYRLEGREFGGDKAPGEILQELLKWAPKRYASKPEFWDFVDKLCTTPLCEARVLEGLAKAIPKNETLITRLEKRALSTSVVLAESALTLLHKIFTDTNPGSRRVTRVFNKVLKSGNMFVKDTAAQLRPDLALRSPIKANINRGHENYGRGDAPNNSLIQRALWFCYNHCPEEFAKPSRRKLSTEFILTKTPQQQRRFFRDVENSYLPERVKAFKESPEKTETMFEVYRERGLRGDFTSSPDSIIEYMLFTDPSLKNIDDYVKIATKHGQSRDSDASRVVRKTVVEHLISQRDTGNHVPLKLFLALGNLDNNVFYFVKDAKDKIALPTKAQLLELGEMIKDPEHYRGAIEALSLFHRGDVDVARAVAKNLGDMPIDPAEKNFQLNPLSMALDIVHAVQSEPEVERTLGHLVTKVAESKSRNHMFTLRNYLSGGSGAKVTGPTISKALDDVVFSEKHALSTRLYALEMQFGIYGGRHTPEAGHKKAILEIVADRALSNAGALLLSRIHQDDPELLKREFLKIFEAIPSHEFAFETLYKLGERGRQFQKLIAASSLSPGILLALQGTRESEPWHTPTLDLAVAKRLRDGPREVWGPATRFLETAKPTREVARVVAGALPAIPDRNIEMLVREWASKETPTGRPVFGPEIVPALVRGWEYGRLTFTDTPHLFSEHFIRFGDARHAEKLNAILLNSEWHTHQKGPAAIALALWEAHQMRTGQPSVMTQEARTALHKLDTEDYIEALRIIGDYSKEAQLAVINMEMNSPLLRNKIEQYFLKGKLDPAVRQGLLSKIAGGSFSDTLVTKARYTFGPNSEDVQSALVLRAARKDDPSLLAAVDYRKPAPGALAHVGYLLASSVKELQEQGLRLLTLAPDQRRDERRILASLNILDSLGDQVHSDIEARKALIRTVVSNNPTSESLDKIASSLQDSYPLRSYILSEDIREFERRTNLGKSCHDMIVNLGN